MQNTAAAFPPPGVDLVTAAEDNEGMSTVGPDRRDPLTRVPRVVVIGGGVAGLVAARELAAGLPPVEVVLLDAGDRVGGKLRREDIGGGPVDVGAESVLARRPEAVDLLAELGAQSEITYPATTSAAVWTRGALQPMPTGTLMGVPGHPERAAGVLTPDEVTRASAEQPWPGEPVEGDLSVGEYVGARLGPAVVDRLVEPLIGGVYAGHAALLSLQSCIPALWVTATSGRSLLETAAAAAEASASGSAAAPRPVFAGLRGGIGRLAELLQDDLVARGVQIRTRTIARELTRTPRGWRITTGPVPSPVALEADAIVLAIPATATARLLRDVAPSAAADLGGIEYASMAIVTLAVRRDADWLAGLPGSGFLVPPVDGRVIKAATFTAAKWEWAASSAPDTVTLRASIGRAGETTELQRDDPELVALAATDVTDAMRGPLPEVLDWHVQRWGGALPQYAVGHASRVARARAAVTGIPGLELAGAAYDGVGVPACIGSGRAAAAAVAAHLLEESAAGRG